MSFEEARLAFEILQAIVTVALWLYVRGVNKHRATVEHIDKLEDVMAERIDGHEHRITRVEESIRHAPKHEDLGSVYRRIDELSGAVRELVGVMGGVQRSLARVEDKLMDAND